MTTTTLRLPGRIERLPQLRRIVRGGLAARGAMGAGLATKASGAAENGLLNNLIAYWPGSEASGNLLDAHTNALHLTDTNTVTNAAGKVYSTARQYTAANSEYHTRNDEALLSTGNIDFTIAAWVYKNSSGVQVVASKDNGGTQREWILFATDTATAFACYPGGSYTPANGSVISLSEWHFLVVWRDAAASKIYTQIDNGTATEANCGALSDSAAAFRIGYADYESTLFWNGRIGPVAMWKSAAGAGGCLSAAQRLALYNSGAGLAYSAFTT